MKCHFLYGKNRTLKFKALSVLRESNIKKYTYTVYIYTVQCHQIFYVEYFRFDFVWLIFHFATLKTLWPSWRYLMICGGCTVFYGLSAWLELEAWLVLPQKVCNLLAKYYKNLWPTPDGVEHSSSCFLSSQILWRRL